MRKSVLLPLLFLAAPAMAGTFTAPEGCQATLTIQSRGCTVSHYYTCEKDPAGNKWRADYDAQGPYYLSMVDSETQWIESYELDLTGSKPTIKETLDPNPKDPASFSELLDTGLDSFDFNLTKETGERTHITGFDKLTGKTAVIDGVTLQQTEYEYTQTDEKGTVLRHAKGNEFVNKDWRMFFSGHSEMQAEDGSWVMIEGAPISFISPGEPGFESTTPLFECDAQMSSLSLKLEDPAHDNL